MKKILLFVLFIIILGLGFLVFTDKAEAATTSAFNPGLQCNSPGSVDDCWFYLEPAGGNTYYKIFQASGYVTTSSTNSNASVMVEMCYSTMPTQYDGSCLEVLNRTYGTGNYSFSFAREDVLSTDYSNWNYVVVHVRIYNSTSITAINNSARRVSIDSFASNDNTVTAGESFTVSWEVDQAHSGTTLSWSSSVGGVGTGEQVYGVSGSRSFTPTTAGTINFRLRARGPGISAPSVTEMDTDAPSYVASSYYPGQPSSFSVTVESVAPPSTPPTADIKCRQGSFTLENCTWDYGVSDTISWSSTNATACSVKIGTTEIWTGTSGSRFSGNLYATTRYDLSCTGAGGTATDSTTITIGAAPPGSYALVISKNGTGSGTVSSSPAGINCGSDCSESYTEGTAVTLSASTASGSTFIGWSGGGCSGTGACTVTMNASTTVTATFNTSTSVSYNLTIAKAGTGTGTVTSSPAGINCGSDCSEIYPADTIVTLTATPSGFAGWSGTGVGTCSGMTNPCVLTMDFLKTVTATFNVSGGSSFLLTVSKAGTGTSTITSSPGGINCGSDCSETYAVDTSVVLVSSNSVVTWSGCSSVSGSQCTVTMNAARSVTATIGSLPATGNITFTIVYIPSQGTLVVNSNISASWNISGVGDRSGTSSTDVLTPGTYTITPQAVAGYLTPSAQSATVTASNTTTVNLSYSSAPLNAPTNVSAINTLSAGGPVCGSLLVSWNYTPETPPIGQYFTVWRSENSGQTGAQVSGNVAIGSRSYTDTPAQGRNYWYTVKVHTSIGGNREAVSTQSSVINNPSCTANLSNSTKVLTSSESVKNGDTMSFRITLTNGGPGNATITKICEEMSDNLINMRNLSVIGNATVSGITTDSAECNGETKLNITGTLDKVTNWVITYDTTFSSQVNESYEVCKNKAIIYYTDGAGDHSISRNLNYLCKTEKVQGPSWREVSP